MIRAVILYTGYVETASVGHVMFTPNEDVELTTGVEAVKSLATALFNAWFEQERYYANLTCCKKRYNNDAKFCIKCGKELKVSTIEEFSKEDVETFASYVQGLPGFTVNDFSICEEIEGWTWGGSIVNLLPITEEEIIEVDCAEELFSAILHPEIRKEYCEFWNQIHCSFGKQADFDKILAYELDERTI